MAEKETKKRTELEIKLNKTVLVQEETIRKLQNRIAMIKAQADINFI